MSHWESKGKSDNWYTPWFVFEALEDIFDMDVAGNRCPAYCVPTDTIITRDSLTTPWNGFVWMNPPFGGRNGLEPWLEKFFDHGNGIALTPDRTSAPWFQQSWSFAHHVMFMPKVPFFRADRSRGNSPSNGTALWAVGKRASLALRRAEIKGLGIIAKPTHFSDPEWK